MALFGAWRGLAVPGASAQDRARGAIARGEGTFNNRPTGKWTDVGRFKTPNLRGLAAPAPYVHDGSAPDLDAVVRFYERRFQMGLTPQEAADLGAFLRAI